MKRLIKNSNISNLTIEQKKKILENIEIWIEGDTDNRYIEEIIQLLPESLKTYNNVYRYLAFSYDEIYSKLEEILNYKFKDKINDIEKYKNEFKKVFINIEQFKQLSKLIYNNNTYASFTKNYSNHILNLKEYVLDNLFDYITISIKCNVLGIYIKEILLLLKLELYNQKEEDWIRETIDTSGINFSNQDEVVGKIINEPEVILINGESLKEKSLYDFLKK